MVTKASPAPVQPREWMLLTPFWIGGMEVPNRIMMPAMHLNYHRGLGFADDRLVAFYTERAQGRAGLISVGGFAVELAGAGVFDSLLLGLWGDEYIPDLQRLTRSMKAVHPAGKIACQLYHTGRVSPSKLTGQPAVGASEIPSRFNPEPVKALDGAEIRALEQTYVEAAARAIEAGFDCIDLFCGVGHLLNQFLSPVTNNRVDEYGGSLENRSRIAVNIIRGIRARLPSTPILARLAGHDIMPGGNTHHEVPQIAAFLEAAGVDAFNVTGGWHESRVPQITGEVPTGAFSWLAMSVKAAVSVPVAASNRINDPIVAEAIVRNGQADFVSMGRPLLADPYLPRKLIEGEDEQITHCIACNVCLDSAWHGPARCLVNPQAGRELELFARPAAQPRRIDVIGGGPGGMMAAKTAATRGHRVILYEREARLGGVAAIGDIAPGKKEYRWLYEDLARQVNAHPRIEVRLSMPATVDRVEQDRPDAVIVATGGWPTSTELPGLESSGMKVLHAHNVLANGDAEVGDAVVIVGGGPTACETALYLRELGCLDAETVKFLLVQGLVEPEELRQMAMIGRPHRRVTIVQRAARMAKGLNKSVRWTLLRGLETAGVVMMPSTQVLHIGKGEVQVTTAGGEPETIACDTLIIAAGIAPETALHRELAMRLPALPLYLIGDAASPRQATEALLEAFEVAANV